MLISWQRACRCTFSVSDKRFNLISRGFFPFLSSFVIFDKKLNNIQTQTKSFVMKVKSKESNIGNVYIKCFYRTFEVLSHIKRDDFWVILNRRVLNLSRLMKSMDELPCKNLSVIIAIYFCYDWDLILIFINILILINWIWNRTGFGTN